MTIELHDVGRARVYDESSAGSWSSTTFAIDATTSPGLGSFTDVAFREGSAQVQLMEDMLDPQQVVQSRVEGRKKLRGKRSATLTLTLNLAPSGVAAGSAVSSVAPGGGLGIILRAIMGGEKLAAGTTATAGSTSSVINATSGAGWEEGAWIGWTNSAGIVEWREVKQVATNVVTTKYAFSGTPANGNVLYNAAVYFFTEDPQRSLQFLVEGVETDDRWLLLGGQCTGFKIGIDPTGQQLPSAQITLTFASWLDSSEVSNTAGVTAAIAAASFGNYNPIVGFAGELRYQTVGTATLDSTSLVHASAINFDPSISFVPVTSPKGVNTILRWRAARQNPPVQVGFTAPYEDLTWWTKRKARNDLAFWYTAGQLAGGSVILSAPATQIVNPQRTADASKLAGQSIAAEGRRDIDVATGTTELSKSPVRIVFG